MTSSNAPVNVEPDPLLVDGDGGGGVDVPPPGPPPQLAPHLERHHAEQPRGQ